MIPVEVMNKDGVVSYQLFNDNTAPAEQINRKTLDALVYAQTVLTNTRDTFSRKLGAAEYDMTKLEEINTAADTLVKAIKDATEAFVATL